MQIVLKAVMSLIIIFVATGIIKKFPSLAGLIAVMPLTGALVLVAAYRPLLKFWDLAGSGHCPSMGHEMN